MHKPKTKLIIAAIAALMAELVVPELSSVAQAAPPQFAQAYVRLDRHKVLTRSGSTICATPTAATTGVTESLVKITYPTDSGAATDFTVNATASHWVVDSADLPAGSTFWPGMTSGTTTATNVTGHTVTFASGDLTAGTMYCFHITGGTSSGTATLTNGSLPASSVNIVNATLITYDNAGTPAPVNQTNWSTDVTTDDSIVVSAIVPPNFRIDLSAYADAFTGNLDPAAIVSTSGVTVSIATNAAQGWIAWAKDQYQGLFSATANYTIDSGLKNPYPTQLHASGDPAFDLVASGGGVGREGYVMDTDLTTDATGG